MKTRPRIILSILVVIGSVLLHGCTPAQGTSVSGPILTELATPLHPITTPTLTDTSTTAALSSATPIPPSPTPTLTFTPLPTLTAEESIDFTQELLRTNANCKLPCWWGFTPGTSTWAEVEAFLQFVGIRTGLQSLGDGRIYHGTGGFDLDSPVGITINRLNFLEKEGVIELISISSDGYSNPVDFQEQWSLFSPQRVIELYGIPSRVWLESTSSGPVTEGRIAGYTLWVFYDQFGFLILYHGYGEFEPVFHFCPRFENGQDIRALQMYLQSPDNPSPIEKTARIIGFVPDPYPHVQTIDDAAGLNVAEFYQLFIQEDNLPCFDTPRDIWP